VQKKQGRKERKKREEEKALNKPVTHIKGRHCGQQDWLGG